MAWRDIESAPESGRILVGWSQREQGCEYVGQADWNVRGALMICGQVYLDGPTEGPNRTLKGLRWQPLPPPPSRNRE